MQINSGNTFAGRTLPAQAPVKRQAPAPKFGDMSMLPDLITYGLGAGGVGTTVLLSVRMVPQAHEGLVERFQKYRRTLSPGLNFIIPFIESVKKVDKREIVMDMPPQPTITKDNMGIEADGVVYYKVTDAQKAKYAVADYQEAVRQLVQAGIRELIGELDLDETLGAQEKLSAALLKKLQEADTENWGVEITRVKLQNLTPPKGMIEDMEKQVKAERERRAKVLTAQGDKESAVLRGEGEKQSAILSAEGRKTAAILDAEAHKQRAILEAEGQREAAIKIAEGASQAAQLTGTIDADMAKLMLQKMEEANIGSNVVALKYFEALQKIADGESTKLVIPAQMGGPVGLISTVMEALKATGSGTTTPTA